MSSVSFFSVERLGVRKGRMPISVRFRVLPLVLFFHFLIIAILPYLLTYFLSFLMLFDFKLIATDFFAFNEVTSSSNSALRVEHGNSFNSFCLLSFCLKRAIGADAFALACF